MKHHPWSSALAIALVAALLQACGGGGSSAGTGSMRLINATSTHASLDLLAKSSTAVSTTAQDSGSACVALAPGSNTLQVNDAGKSTSLALSTSSVVKDDHDSLLAFENNGVVKVAVLGEDIVPPTANTAQMRVFDTATDAGSLDVYVTDPGADLSAVSGSPVVAASAGSTAISSGSTSPSVGAYAVVPIANAPLGVTVNNAPLGLPAIALTAGSDLTLLVHGTPTAATVSAIVDDNHLPASSSKAKMRLVNGLTNYSAGLTLNADFSVIASNVLPGTASEAGLATGDATMRLEVTSPLSLQSLYLQTGLNIPGNGVYTLFMLGDGAAPVGLLRKDR
jgi:hypothetical protein